jgi:hypothetical protein
MLRAVSVVRRHALRAFLLALAATACGSSGAVEGDAGQGGARAGVEIGVPAGPDGLDFGALLPDGELRLHSFGQGGTHVFLAIRCIGFGSRAFVSITLTNLQTGAEVTSPAPVRPQLLFCRDADVCDLVPILAMTGGLTVPGAERDGLHIVVAAEVHNEAGLTASASQEAVLSTADL